MLHCKHIFIMLQDTASTKADHSKSSSFCVQNNMIGCLYQTKVKE